MNSTFFLTLAGCGGFTLGGVLVLIPSLPWLLHV
jgi:hypothetical protein